MKQCNDFLNCGLFSKKKDQTPKTDAPEKVRDDYVIMVEDFYRSNKLDPAEYIQVDEENHKRWVCYRGSTVNYIYLIFQDQKSTLRIFSPLVFIPQTNILSLYRKCLELNHSSLVSCSLCIVNDVIGLVIERFLDGLDPEELSIMIDCLTGSADKLDNVLADEFGALIYTEHQQ